MKAMSKPYREPYLAAKGGEGSHDDHRVTADGQTLMRQAPMTANEYLCSRRSIISTPSLGQGYAKAHPELLRSEHGQGRWSPANRKALSSCSAAFSPPLSSPSR
jgi:hypothetical protein